MKRTKKLLFHLFLITMIVCNIQTIYALSGDGTTSTNTKSVSEIANCDFGKNVNAKETNTNEFTEVQKIFGPISGTAGGEWSFNEPIVQQDENGVKITHIYFKSKEEYDEKCLD